MIKGSKKVFCKASGKLITGFEHKWGIKASELAKLEGISPEAIHMRVRNFGNPFQRRKTLTYWEKKYDKTIVELAEELNLHPISIAGRDRLYGDCRIDPSSGMGRWNKGKQHEGVERWQDKSQYKVAGMRTFFKLDEIS